MIKIILNDLPSFYKKSNLYKNFNISNNIDDKHIFIPEKYFTNNISINNNKDLIKILNIFNFWLFDELFFEIFDFIYKNNDSLLYLLNKYIQHNIYCLKNFKNELKIICIDFINNFSLYNSDNLQLDFTIEHSNFFLLLIKFINIPSTKLTNFATQNNLFTILKWIKYKNFLNINSNDYVNSIDNNNLDMIKFIEYYDIQKNYDSRFINRIVENGNLDLLIWVKQLKPHCPWNEYTCCIAAEYGYLEILKWLRNSNPQCPWEQSIFRMASFNGHLNIIKWIIEQNPDFEIDIYTSNFAIVNKHLHIIEWINQNNFIIDNEICNYIAEKNDLETLKWARSLNPPLYWNEDTCMWATYNGNLEMLKWLKSQKPECPWLNGPFGQCYWIAQQNNDNNIIDWINLNFNN
jgi:hypothetical protein